MPDTFQNGLEVAQQIALWADRLRQHGALGGRFADNIYDEQRYADIRSIAMEMMALATDTPLVELEPLRKSVFSRPTPFTSGDAAVVNDAGRLLLIQRADNNKWAMPGGALEVGETPAAGCVREAFEETGVRSEAVKLVGVFDSRFCGTLYPHHLYHFVFLCRPLAGPRLLAGPAVGSPSHAHEVLDVGWFAENELPAEMDPGHVTRIPEVFRVWRGDGRPFFDR